MRMALFVVASDNANGAFVVFFQLNTLGSTRVRNCTLTNAFHRVRVSRMTVSYYSATWAAAGQAVFGGFIFIIFRQHCLPVQCVCVRARAKWCIFKHGNNNNKKKRKRERESERERKHIMTQIRGAGGDRLLSPPPPPPHPNTSERARFKTPIVIIFIHRILLSSNKQLSDGGNWTSLRL